MHPLKGVCVRVLVQRRTHTPQGEELPMSEPEDIAPDDDDFSVVSAMIAETAAQTALIGDLFFLLGSIDPIAIGRLRDHARHLLGAAELNMFEAAEGLDLLTYHQSRHSLLEAACARIGIPHKGADIIPFTGPRVRGGSQSGRANLRHDRRTPAA